MFLLLLSSPITLAQTALYVFCLVMPVLWMDHQLKTRLSARPARLLQQATRAPLRARRRQLDPLR